jgi:predicted enzyme related to lactoylglutathione lyase
MDEKLKKHGAISWSELITTDVSGAKSFYGELFGWTYDDMPMEDSVYSVFSANGEEIGGMMTLPPQAQEMPPCWGQYVTVDNVDETAQKAVACGGKIIMPPKDIPEVGRFCVIQDPQGAFISIITYEKYRISFNLFFE